MLSPKIISYDSPVRRQVALRADNLTGRDEEIVRKAYSPACSAQWALARVEGVEALGGSRAAHCAELTYMYGKTVHNQQQLDIFRGFLNYLYFKIIN